jgi:hypothetical protein
MNVRRQGQPGDKAHNFRSLNTRRKLKEEAENSKWNKIFLSVSIGAVVQNGPRPPSRVSSNLPSSGRLTYSMEHSPS